MRELNYRITALNLSQTVGSFLSKEGFSRRLIIRLKQEPRSILLNAVHARTVDKISIGDTLTISISDCSFLEGNAELNVPIVYEDEDVVVFNKPTQMPVHPSHHHQGDTLGNFFASKYPETTFRVINRLDSDTSGLCVIGKNQYAATRLQSSLDKTYFAIVCGQIESSGTISAPIGRVDDSLILREVRSDGQAAVTNYSIIKTTEKYTFVHIKLQTGRTHQIRVHFSHIGHSLAGDDMYGGLDTDIQQQALHCGEVSFPHPISLKSITLCSEIREDMKKLLQL